MLVLPENKNQEIQKIMDSVHFIKVVYLLVNG